MSNVNDLINQNKARAKLIQRWCIAGLFLSILLYIVFHLWLFDPPAKWTYLDWYGVTTKSGISERALDWTLWGLIGTFIYLLTEVTSHYRDIKRDAPKDSSFLAYTPWYVSTLLKGPFTVLVIMLFINAANLNLTGDTSDNPAIAFTFSKLDHRVTVAIAFVLGFYSRVGRSVLDNVVKSLFPKAWAEAHQSFVIKSGNKQVVIGEGAIFETSPKTDVVWSASLGSIDAAGKYTAPTSQDDSNKNVVISAVSTDKQSIARATTVELLPFRISVEPDVDVLVPGTAYTFTAPPEFEVKWSATNGNIDPGNGKFSTDAETEAKEVTITATVKKGSHKGKYSRLTLKYKD